MLNWQLFQDQPTYANGKISKDDGNHVKTNWDESRAQPDWSHRPPASLSTLRDQGDGERTRRNFRSQSVQPVTSEPLHGKANFQAKRFNTVKRDEGRTERARSERAQSMTRSFPLTKSISTASNINNVERDTAKDAEMHRLPTVLHIPDIKPR